MWREAPETTKRSGQPVWVGASDSDEKSRGPKYERRTRPFLTACTWRAGAWVPASLEIILGPSINEHQSPHPSVGWLRWNKPGVGTRATGGVALPRYRVPGRDEPLTVVTAENGGATRQIRRPQQRFLALMCNLTVN